MAITFKKGDIVHVKVDVPTGPVRDFRLDDEGAVWYLVEWTDSLTGLQAERWFPESALTAPPATP